VPNSQLDIVGLGLATLDVLIRCEDGADAAHRLVLRDFMMEGGGPVATALCAASRLGARTGYVGTAGSDFGGEAKLLSLTRYDVDVSHVLRRQDAEQQVILVRVDALTGERSFSGLGGWDQPLRPDELDRDYITSARVLHLDGCHTEAALAAAAWMREAGKPVVLDAATTRGSVREQMQELVRRVDVLICGSGFAQALTGEDVTAAACRAATSWGPRTVVQTEGADGSCTACPEGEFRTPAFDVDVVDTTGAGDVFHGAYIVGMLKGWSPQQVAAFASAVSAMKCTKLGGREGVGSFDETVEFCRDRGVDL
jgi:sugar/nucleoside kinase (ribokinase family)